MRFSLRLGKTGVFLSLPRPSPSSSFDAPVPFIDENSNDPSMRAEWMKCSLTELMNEMKCSLPSVSYFWALDHQALLLNIWRKKERNNTVERIAPVIEEFHGINRNKRTLSACHDGHDVQTEKRSWRQTSAWGFHFPWNTLETFGY